MILTITLNPSIDKRYIVDEFQAGSIYRTEKYEYTPGGKGINVSKVISSLGESVFATGFLGGKSGQYIREELDKMDIKNNFISIEGETRSCLNIISSNNQTEILESGPNISEEELNKFYKLYEKLLDKYCLICGSGSLPKGVPLDTYGSLIDMANKKGRKFILDTSGKALEKALPFKPYMIKPNLEELSKLVNRKIENENDIINEVKNLNAEIVCLSMGDKGALIFNNKTMYRIKIPKVDTLNVVGSGDSMVGGFATGVSRDYNFEGSLILSAACGTANAMEEETGKIDLNNVKKLIGEIQVEKIKI